ncbi:glutamate--tRNA ligase [Striga asiatica]|uniref:Glutamate--tRNA ligase n=1 Tax=Striga asiatica TaxID=4170 RepID=A0A5A7QV34_STRAF|nr:glutamate--tRNA ligase [Striga asiatica]
MSEELHSIQLLIAGNEQAEPSLPSVSEVEERVRTYLEQHGWPEEYELEFLLEHYALLDWLAVSLSFHRPQSTKKIIIYGLIKQARKSIPERVPPSLSGFDPPLKAYRWQADLLSFYFGPRTTFSAFSQSPDTGPVNQEMFKGAIVIGQMVGILRSGMKIRLDRIPHHQGSNFQLQGCCVIGMGKESIRLQTILRSWSDCALRFALLPIDPSKQKKKELRYRLNTLLGTSCFTRSLIGSYWIASSSHLLRPLRLTSHLLRPLAYLNPEGKKLSQRIGLGWERTSIEKSVLTGCHPAGREEEFSFLLVSPKEGQASAVVERESFLFSYRSSALVPAYGAGQRRKPLTSSLSRQASTVVTMSSLKPAAG